MKLQDATERALALLEEMAPHCHRAAIAGSIRRKKPEVTDIELVVIAKWAEMADQSDLFSTRTQRVNLLHQWALTSGIRWIYKRDGQPIDTTIKDDGRMWKGLLPCGAQLDLFITTPERWGTIFLIRTGSADFSHEIMKHAAKVKAKFEGGVLHVNGAPVETPEEADVFRHLKLRYVRPEERVDGSAVHRAKGRG